MMPTQAANNARRRSLRKTSCCSKSDQPTGEMQETAIVDGLLVPANEQTAKAIEPRMRSLHYPAARFVPCFLLEGLGFFPTRADMGRKAKLRQDGTHLVVVIALVQAHPLRL